MIKCKNCGNASDIKSENCFYCGKKLKQSVLAGLLQTIVICFSVFVVLWVLVLVYQDTGWYKQAREKELVESIPGISSDDYEGRYRAYMELHRLTKKQEYIDKSQIYKELMAASWRSSGVEIGMSKQRVLLSNWGFPTKINRTVTGDGEREQWVYGRGRYLYFDGDKLVTIQD